MKTHITASIIFSLVLAGITTAQNQAPTPPSPTGPAPSGAAGAVGAATNPAETTAASLPCKYMVEMNTEKGIIVTIMAPRVTNTNITTGMSRIGGGGGGRSFQSIEWRETQRMAFIPHVEATKAFENGSTFNARTDTTGQTERISEIQVIPILRFIESVTDAQLKAAHESVQKAQPTSPSAAPTNPQRRQVPQSPGASGSSGIVTSQSRPLKSSGGSMFHHRSNIPQASGNNR